MDKGDVTESPPDSPDSPDSPSPPPLPCGRLLRRCNRCFVRATAALAFTILALAPKSTVGFVGRPRRREHATVRSGRVVRPQN